jgi:glycolate oxidase FAD binding subunit
MPRLYLGSLGTLGVVVSANFKVLPRPRAETTVLATSSDAVGAFAAADRLRQSQAPLAALEVFLRDGAWQVAARIEGRAPTVDAVAARVATDAAAPTVRIDGSDSAAWWGDYVAEQATEPEFSGVVVRCGVRPRETVALAGGVLAALSEIGGEVPLLAASPAIGTVLARLDFGTGGSPERLAEAQAVLLGLADTVTILAAPSGWKRGIDVWGRLPDGFDVMRALREEFDPARTINPGRFAGFL